MPRKNPQHVSTPRPSDGYSGEDLMLILLGLDPGVSVKFSEHTRMWYVNTSRLIGHCTQNSVGGVTEHRSEPREAVKAFFDNLVKVPDGHILGVDWGHGQRAYKRWNGAAFVDTSPPWDEEVPR